MFYLLCVIMNVVLLIQTSLLLQGLTNEAGYFTLSPWLLSPNQKPIAETQITLQEKPEDMFKELVCHNVAFNNISENAQIMVLYSLLMKNDKKEAFFHKNTPTSLCLWCFLKQWLQRTE